MQKFYSYYNAAHSHSNAQIIVRSNIHHEGHFGVQIRNSHTPGHGGIYIETVEHAEALISALQEAIRTQLYTEEELDIKSSHTRTLHDLDILTRRSERPKACHTDELKESLQMAIDWIDAVPQETILPAMPGFDRDYVNGILNDTY